MDPLYSWKNTKPPLAICASKQEGRVWCLGFLNSKRVCEPDTPIFVSFHLHSSPPYTIINFNAHFLVKSLWLLGIYFIYFTLHIVSILPRLEPIISCHVTSFLLFIFEKACVRACVRALILRLAREDGRNFRSVPHPHPSVWSLERRKIFCISEKTQWLLRDFDELVGEFLA